MHGVSDTFRKFIHRLILTTALLLLVGNATAAEPQGTAVASNQLMLAHYMPWYATKDASGRWGWHWTMNHFDPNRVLSDGRREVASHDYPLIGLYDSGDDPALECQALLMKLAGLDGVIIDWYGTRKLNDYAANHRNTKKLIPWLKKGGLRFAICYEDQALKQLQAGEDLQQGTLDLQWAEEQWFGDEAYVKQDGRPVLLVFGPQHLKRDQWSRLRAGLTSKPLLFGLPHLAKAHDADGVFGWPPVSGGKSLLPEQWRKELDSLYARRVAGESVIATAFPGFKDIYREACLHGSYGHIDHRNGATFADTLDLAIRSSSPIIQVATWNDYGEGTVIEPTRNHGYRYLEHLQKHSKAAKVRSAADLRLPVMLYRLRKRSAGDADLAVELNKASEMLFAGKCFQAGAALAKIRGTLGYEVVPK